jgi:hypothetical protein
MISDWSFMGWTAAHRYCGELSYRLNWLHSPFVLMN